MYYDVHLPLKNYPILDSHLLYNELLCSIKNNVYTKHDKLFRYTRHTIIHVDLHDIIDMNPWFMTLYMYVYSLIQNNLVMLNPYVYISIKELTSQTENIYNDCKFKHQLTVLVYYDVSHSISNGNLILLDHGNHLVVPYTGLIIIFTGRYEISPIIGNRTHKFIQFTFDASKKSNCMNMCKIL